MINGKVVWFSDEKGFGFVESEGKQYFAHFKEISGTGFKKLKEGEAVSFEPGMTSKGPIATSISVIKLD